MINKFTDLTTWQEAHKFVLAIYRITENFPPRENYALSSQIRRASLSISSNIAEGFGRRSAKDKEHFYVMAYGSLVESENQLIVAKDLDYIDSDTFESLERQAHSVGQLINGLLRAHRS